VDAYQEPVQCDVLLESKRSEHSIFTIDNGHMRFEWRGREPIDEKEQVVEARWRLACW
jgi:hypothetical protein